MTRNRAAPDPEEPEEFLPVEEAASLLGVSTGLLIETMHTHETEEG
jgi:hypothetical protein